MIKVSENTHTKNGRLNIEAVTKMGDHFTICQYKTEESKWDMYSYFFKGLTVLVWNRHAVLRFKMASLQTDNKKHGTKNVAI